MELFLHCYERLFAVKARVESGRIRTGLSYDLSAEKFERLCNLFGNLEIPYKTEFIESKCYIDKPERIKTVDLITGEMLEIYDPSPANSRVVIEIGSDQFNISNFNTYLIKARYSEKIVKAFDAKGLVSRVELMGQYYNVDFVPVFKEKYTPPPKAEIKPKHEQISLF